MITLICLFRLQLRQIVRYSRDEIASLVVTGTSDAGMTWRDDPQIFAVRRATGH
jgi:hypothetical protein